MPSPSQESVLFPKPSKSSGKEGKIVVSQVLQQYWPNLCLVLDESPIKESQYVTWSAKSSDGMKYIVRVTPDNTGAVFARVSLELEFIAFVVKSLPADTVCRAIASSTGDLVVQSTTAHPFVVSVFDWAIGTPVDYMAMHWLNDPEIGRAWGRTFAQIHAAGREFLQLHPDARFPLWTDIHHGVMSGMEHELSPKSKKAWEARDPSRIGVLHGDLNVSNFYVRESASQPVSPASLALSVFDWDQVQSGFYAYDLSQAMVSPFMMGRSGLPGAGTPVPGGVDARPLMLSIIEGYESIAGPGSIDEVEFEEMTAMRSRFYERFCRRGVAELTPRVKETRPDLVGMYAFMKGVVDMYDRYKPGVLPVCDVMVSSGSVDAACILHQSPDVVLLEGDLSLHSQQLTDAYHATGSNIFVKKLTAGGRFSFDVQSGHVHLKSLTGDISLLTVTMDPDSLVGDGTAVITARGMTGGMREIEFGVSDDDGLHLLVSEQGLLVERLRYGHDSERVAWCAAKVTIDDRTTWTTYVEPWSARKE
eukprot:gnl/Dysnectes_brevis/2142_a2492_1779.p1 GENE.gnl/Dysnectes_brevis/2142_a2492_1779~~gnl/Dysnectes_brevis/2142_a2492_1779.p1  ORF type:complete len:532 (-),score=96.54 gnl/Dysnectes_brevis/2142_a2492_1779:74-1669(-)